MKKEIQEECKLKRNYILKNYILKFTNNKNIISESYYTEINEVENDDLN